MARTKAVQRETSIGQNVTFSVDPQGRFHFIVDPANDGPQTKGSKGLDQKGRPKKPNEMVGSTGSYMTLPVRDEQGRECNIMLHLTRPMEVSAVRKARALRELAAEEPVAVAAGTVTPQDRLAIRKLGLSVDDVVNTAEAEGLSVSDLLEALS